MSDLDGMLCRMKLDIEISRTYPNDHHFGDFCFEGHANIPYEYDEGENVEPRRGVAPVSLKLAVPNNEENRKRFHYGAKVTVTIE